MNSQDVFKLTRAIEEMLFRATSHRWSVRRLDVHGFPIAPDRPNVKGTSFSDDGRMFTTETLADHLALSERYIRDLVSTGQLASYKIGKTRRFSPDDVEAFLRTQRAKEST